VFLKKKSQAKNNKYISVAKGWMQSYHPKKGYEHPIWTPSTKSKRSEE